MASDYVDPKDYSAVRRILRSEITWLIAAMAAVATFFQQVVIPINNMQIQLTQIQQQLSANQTTLTNYDARITQNSNDIIKLQQEVK